MSTGTYGISFLEFNLITHEWDTELNTRGEIPYLQVTKYHFKKGGGSLKKLWCCIGGREQQGNLVLSTELIT